MMVPVWINFFPLRHGDIARKTLRGDDGQGKVLSELRDRGDERVLKANRAIDAAAMIEFCQRLLDGEQRPNAFQGRAYRARIAWADDIVKRTKRHFSTLCP